MANKIVSLSIEEKTDKKYSDLSSKTKIPKSRIIGSILEDYGDEWIRRNVKI